MWAIPTGTGWFCFKKKKKKKSPIPESRVPETGSDPPIGSDRDSGRDIMLTKKNKQRENLENCQETGKHKNKRKFTSACDEDHKCSTARQMHLGTIPGNDAILIRTTVG